VKNEKYYLSEKNRKKKSYFRKKKINEGAGISFFQCIIFFTDFSMTDGIFYFSDISSPVTVLIMHPQSHQRVKGLEFQISRIFPLNFCDL
jgi:hypothetical protein